MIGKSHYADRGQKAVPQFILAGNIQMLQLNEIHADIEPLCPTYILSVYPGRNEMYERLSDSFSALQTAL